MISNKSIQYFYCIILIVFVSVIPFEEKAKAVPNILLAVLSFLWVLIIKKKDLLETIRTKVFIFFALLLFYIIAKSLVTNQIIEDLFIIKKLALFVAIIVLAIPFKNFKLMRRAFIASTLLAVLISLVNIFGYIYTQEEFKFSLGTLVNEILISERLYIGFSSIISMVFLIEEYNNINNKFQKTMVLLLGALLMFFVFLIAARIAIISIIIILLIYVFTQLNSPKRTATLLFLFGFIGVFFVLNDNLTKRFFRADDVYRKTFYDKVAKHEPRFIIWNCSFDIIKNDLNYVFGNGFGTVKSQLVKCYNVNIDLDHKREWFVKSRFNTHNQYLSLLLGSGIIGLSLFLASLFYLFKESNRNFNSIALISALLLFLSVENIFQRQIGVYLFSLIVIAILKLDTKNQIIND